jgi:hypothetical protein
MMEITAGIVLFIVLTVFVVAFKKRRVDSNTLQDWANIVTVSSVISAGIVGLIVGISYLIKPAPLSLPPVTSTAPTTDNRVYVPATSTGYSTEIIVHQGNILIFSSSGDWCWGGGNDCSSANGTPGRPKPDEGRPILEDDSYGKLIGRVGDWIFPIGISSEVEMLADGELVLLMNDSVHSDNSGTLTVLISKK